jgi:hypothetical protein
VIEDENAWSTVAKKTHIGNRDSAIHGVVELTNGQAGSLGEITLQMTPIVIKSNRHWHTELGFLLDSHAQIGLGQKLGSLHAPEG